MCTLGEGHIYSKKGRIHSGGAHYGKVELYWRAIVATETRHNGGPLFAHWTAI